MSRPVEALRHPDMPDPSVLSRIAERLKRELGAEKVVVYGSVARGEATIDSDIDLLVIAPSREKEYVRMANVHRAIRDLSFRLPISPIVLTPDEVQRRLEQGDPFLREILETGVPV